MLFRWTHPPWKPGLGGAGKAAGAESQDLPAESSFSRINTLSS